jgi:hypothetical protein
MNKKPGGWGLALMLLFAGPAIAATLEEDEARIEALLQAERAAAAAARAGQATTLAAATPAPVLAAVVAPPIRARGPDDDWLAPTPAEDTGLAFADLGRHIGEKVAIVTAGDRVHRGTVVDANARQVILQVRRSGGLARYALLREQIVRILEH